jgi:ParB-like chromosome segregation protein Spo0J
MGWREYLKVHPAADVFPMMSDEELAALGEDIKKNGLMHPLVTMPIGEGLPVLVDGRNRIEAMERVGIKATLAQMDILHGDPVSFVIAANIRRRHLTKQQQADLIVAAVKASRQDGEVPRHVKGKAGSEKDPVKAEAVAAGAEHGISQRTVERAFEKADPERAAKAKLQKERRQAAADYNQRARVAGEVLMADMRAGQKLEQELATMMIDIGFKSLAKEYHPDMPEGSRDAMTALNKVRARLKGVYGAPYQIEPPLRRKAKQQTRRTSA